MPSITLHNYRGCIRPTIRPLSAKHYEYMISNFDTFEMEVLSIGGAIITPKRFAELYVLYKNVIYIAQYVIIDFSDNISFHIMYNGNETILT